MNKFSINKLSEDYCLYSEGIQKKYGGFELDQNSLVKSVNAETLDLKELQCLLLSTDLN